MAKPIHAFSFQVKRVVFSCISFLLFFSGCRLISAQYVSIGLHLSGLSESLIYQSLGEEVIIYSGDSFPIEVTRLGFHEQIKIFPSEGKVVLENQNKAQFKGAHFHFFCNDEDPAFELIPNASREKARVYKDELRVGLRGKNLFLINTTQLEPYVAGVVQAEAGHHQSLEFLKVQAISARTYVLANAQKHKNEQFDLCDQTHCQVYKGKGNTIPLIQSALESTKGLVIVYEDSILVDAVFSANCGGTTANSEEVWIKEIDYLRSVSDDNFCEGFVNHDWHFMLNRMDFLRSLSEYYHKEVWKFEVQPDASGRVKKLILNNSPALSISGEELRRIFKLKSSKMHLIENRGLIYFEGQGFGHGVGLCQDGAYFLSQSGMDYLQIIQHYYSGVSVRPLSGISKVLY